MQNVKKNSFQINFNFGSAGVFSGKVMTCVVIIGNLKS